MYYVALEMKNHDGSVTKIGTTATREIDKAVSQLTAYGEVAECLVCAEVVKSYELKLGTIPTCVL